jgi:molybdopterin molybdotransferase
VSDQTRITLEEALRLMADVISPLKPVSVSLRDALGRVLAEPVRAAMDQPPFARSPYDGYAFKSEDSRSASTEHPVTLDVVARSLAGAPADRAVMKGQAVRIMTGGVIPEGADCVIMQEQTDCGEQKVQICRQLPPHANCCERGEDFKTGDLIIDASMPLNAAEYAVLTSAGCKAASVFPSPRVEILSTGKELVSAGAPLSAGQIYDSNSAFISARLMELNIPVAAAGHVDDDLNDLMHAFSSAAERADFVISTGGVSVGEKDLVPQSLEQLGAEIIFHGVDLKPGMPAAFAVLHGVPILALSGNPFAAAVSCELLARPALALLSSDPRLKPVIVKARLSSVFEKNRPIRRFLRGILNNGMVSIPASQGNGQMLTMIGCNCLIELPSGDNALPEGSDVSAYML